MKFTVQQFQTVFARYTADYDKASGEISKYILENDPATFIFVASGISVGMVRPADVRVFSIIYDCIREAGYKFELSPCAMLDVKEQFAADKQAFIEGEISWLAKNNPVAYQLIETVPYDSLLALLYLAIARRTAEFPEPTEPANEPVGA